MIRALFLLTFVLHAETGYNAWLRYAALEKPPALPAVVVVQGDSPVLLRARDELIRGVRGMTGRTLRIETGTPNEPAISLGTGNLTTDSFMLKITGRDTTITGGGDRGALYGVFAFLRKIALGEPLDRLDETQTPRVPVRWVNEWNNLDGSIERGYGGRSIFWDNLKSREDLSRVKDYGRMLASLGINGCSINNVNVNPRILAPEFLPEIKRIADVFRPWGVRTVISVDFGSPKTVGGLDTFDPLDPKVAEWWKSKVDEIYRVVPDLGGLLIKADSEGRVGPSAYNRTHADAANVMARALKPHGGLLFYRGFVYDHHMDWRNLKNDRARAADDNFRALDGKFDDNVVIQIKHGPIDFQVREPASPLFGTLEKTKQAIELQITQEYFGQGRHTVFLIPMWKEVLDFDVNGPVKSRVNGFVGVSNVGLDENWYGNHLSQANLYGFGRLAWNPDLTSQQIVDEWTKLTFGSDPKVVNTIDDIQLTSWRTYEDYTGPLGLQTLTDITGDHYGVNVEASERNGWGQWHRADEHGVGMDRTVATGTGFIGQYRAAVAKVYDSIESCPDDLLLFMHHVPYTQKLHSGKTVIQYIYDSHYEGADAVAGYVRQWKTLAGAVDEQRYRDVLAQLEYQAGQAIVWRDAVTNWFHKASGIADAEGRVGNYPGRYEAEAMKLDGYTVRDITPAEDASGGKAVACASASGCAATLRFDGAPGWYTLHVQYFDSMDGASHYRVLVGKQVIEQWTAADRVPTRRMDSTSSSRRVIPGIALRPGDEIRIEGVPDRTEPAGLDYLEVVK
ncbi:MAG TPA: alpha-glucuronidase family glycosyl hydrolase [Candidatus Acidoferrales bacterium]|nr:alpha-glucuronidase family glycosyl hydrolase [Candidatus Acidoferrales bacterium]